MTWRERREAVGTIRELLLVLIMVVTLLSGLLTGCEFSPHLTHDPPHV